MIIQGECYDDLKDLIRDALRVRNLLIDAERTSSADKVEEFEEKEEREE